MLARKLIAAMAGQASGAAAYRYWRIYISENNGYSGATIIVEVELRGSVGGADLTSPSTPVAESSSAGSEFDGAKTVDNSLSSLWQGNESSGAWVRFDLGSPQVVGQVAIYPYSSLATTAPKNFTLQGSNDGTTFSDVKSFTGVTGWTAAWKTFDL